MSPRVWSLAKPLLGLVLLLGPGACAAPVSPYNVAPVDFDKLQATPPPVAPRAPEGTPRIVVGMFDSSATNPVGGLYDFTEYSISPLYRTYYFPGLPAQMFELVADALKASGVRASRDYTGNGLLSLQDGTVRDARVVTATITRFGHHQLKTDQFAQGLDAVALEARVMVLDAEGTARYQQDHTVTVMITAQSTDVLQALATQLVTQLLATSSFVEALGEKTGGAR
jgi:hypothetical protein